MEGGGGTAYNAASGACLDLGDLDFQRITRLLEGGSEVDFSVLEDRAVELGGALLAGGFVVDASTDELAGLRERGRGAKDGGPLVLTISPTFACNLDCGYCFVGKKQGTMSIETEHQVLAFVRRYLDERGIPVVKESLYGFPEPRSQPCGAVTSRGWVINEDGTLHKCGLDLDTEARAVGRLGEPVDAGNENMKFWEGYDHFSDPSCRSCRALPLCLGGCARDRREGRDQAVDENCRYHLTHEPRIIAQHVRLARANRRKPSARAL